MPCLSCAMRSFNGAFLLFLELDNGNRTTAFVGVLFIAEAIYDQCCMLPAVWILCRDSVFTSLTSFRGYVTHIQKALLLFQCWSCCRFPSWFHRPCKRAHKNWCAAAPELQVVLWAESWVFSMPGISKDDSSSSAGPRTPGGGRLGES